MYATPLEKARIFSSRINRKRCLPVVLPATSCECLYIAWSCECEAPHDTRRSSVDVAQSNSQHAAQLEPRETPRTLPHRDQQRRVQRREGAAKGKATQACAAHLAELLDTHVGERADSRLGPRRELADRAARAGSRCWRRLGEAPAGVMLSSNMPDGEVH